MAQLIKLININPTDDQLSFSNKINFNFKQIIDIANGIKTIKGDRGDQGFPGIPGLTGNKGDRGYSIFLYDSESDGDYIQWLESNGITEDDVVIKKIINQGDDIITISSGSSDPDHEPEINLNTIVNNLIINNPNSSQLFKKNVDTDNEENSKIITFLNEDSSKLVLHNVSNISDLSQLSNNSLLSVYSNQPSEINFNVNPNNNDSSYKNGILIGSIIDGVHVTNPDESLKILYYSNKTSEGNYKSDILTQAIFSLSKNDDDDDDDDKSTGYRFINHGGSDAKNYNLYLGNSAYIKSFNDNRFSSNHDDLKNGITLVGDITDDSGENPYITIGQFSDEYYKIKTDAKLKLETDSKDILISSIFNHDEIDGESGDINIRSNVNGSAGDINITANGKIPGTITLASGGFAKGGINLHTFGDNGGNIDIKTHCTGSGSPGNFEVRTGNIGSDKNGGDILLSTSVLGGINGGESGKITIESKGKESGEIKIECSRFQPVSGGGLSSLTLTTGNITLSRGRSSISLSDSNGITYTTRYTTSTGLGSSDHTFNTNGSFRIIRTTKIDKGVAASTINIKGDSTEGSRFLGFTRNIDDDNPTQYLAGFDYMPDATGDNSRQVLYTGAVKDLLVEMETIGDELGLTNSSDLLNISGIPNQIDKGASFIKADITTIGNKKIVNIYGSVKLTGGNDVTKNRLYGCGEIKNGLGISPHRRVVDIAISCDTGIDSPRLIEDIDNLSEYYDGKKITGRSLSINGFAFDSNRPGIVIIDHTGLILVSPSRDDYQYHMRFNVTYTVNQQ